LRGDFREKKAKSRNESGSIVAFGTTRGFCHVRLAVVIGR